MKVEDLLDLVDRLCGMQTKGAMEGCPKCRPFCRRNSWMAPYHASTSGTARLERKRPSCFRSSDAALSANAVLRRKNVGLSCQMGAEGERHCWTALIIRIVDRFETRASDPRAKRVTDRREDGKWPIVCPIDKGFFDPKQLIFCVNASRSTYCSNFEVMCLQ